VLAACGLLTVTAAGAPAASGPHLKLVRAAPLTVRGTGFHVHEHVRVVLREQGRMVAARAIAGVGGSFTATFATARVSRCSGFWVGATGDRGSRATMPRPLPLPACSPVTHPGAPVASGRTP
jgi:hypothetical protein